MPQDEWNNDRVKGLGGAGLPATLWNVGVHTFGFGTAALYAARGTFTGSFIVLIWSQILTALAVPTCLRCQLPVVPTQEPLPIMCSRCHEVGCHQCIQQFGHVCFEGWGALCFDCAWIIGGGDSPDATAPLNFQLPLLEVGDAAADAQPLEAAHSDSVFTFVLEPNEDPHIHAWYL